MKKKVLIVDDHPVILMAVAILLERAGYEVCAQTDNGIDALRLTRELAPDVVVLDIGIPRLDGLEVIRRLNGLDNPPRVLVLTSQSAEAFAMRCMQAGAAGFASKQDELGKLVDTIKGVLSGYTCFPHMVLNSLRKGKQPADESELLQRLSDREMMVLQQLSRGLTNKQIADGMLLSNKTISTYKTRLLQKLNARSLVDLIQFAKRNHLA